jgi:hypothetical protein
MLFLAEIADGKLVWEPKVYQKEPLVYVPAPLAAMPSGGSSMAVTIRRG